jgi:hypothetical protein
MEFSKRLQRGDRTRSLLIRRRENHAGWEIREEVNSKVVRSSAIADWHRVERTREIFELEASILTQDGWTEA